MKSKILEIDKLLRDSGREVVATKTTADRHDALLKHAVIIHEWAETQTELEPEWDFEVVVNDVAKVGDDYFAHTGTTKSLEPFLDQGKPLISWKHSFALTDEQRKTVTTGDKLLVKCKIRVSFFDYVKLMTIGMRAIAPEINGTQVLFHLRVDDRALGSTQEQYREITKPFALVFYMDDTDISVADVKKGPQTKPARPPTKPTRPK